MRAQGTLPLEQDPLVTVGQTALELTCLNFPHRLLLQIKVLNPTFDLARSTRKFKQARPDPNISTRTKPASKHSRSWETESIQ